MQGQGAGHDKHGRGVNVLEGQVADELRLNDCADIGKVCAEVVHIANSFDGCDGCLDLAEVLIGFTKELFCFAIVGGGFGMR